MTDTTPAATARDALALALHEAKWQPAMGGKSLAKCLFARESFAHKMDHDAQADAILAALPDGWTLAAEAPVAAVMPEVVAAARRVVSAQVYEVPGDPCKGLDVGFVRALRLLHEALAAAEARPNATAVTARDALVAKVTSDWDADPYGEYEAARSRLIADLDNLIALAAAAAPGRVAGEVEAACSDRGCLHYDDEEPPCVGHMPSICCAKLSASIGAAAVADYRDVTPALTAAALADAMRATGGQVFEGGEAVPAAFYLPWAEAILAAAAPTPSDPVARCGLCGIGGGMYHYHVAPGARDE